MPFIDPQAAALVKKLREQRAVSPEQMAEEIAEIAKDPQWTRGAVDAYTIRRIENKWFVPTLRVQFVIGHYFGKRHDQIWRPNSRVEVDGRQGVAA